MKTLSTLVPSLSFAGLLLVPAAAQDAEQQSTARTGLVRVQLSPQEPPALQELPAPTVELQAQRITLTNTPSGLAFEARGGVQITEQPAGVAQVWDTGSPAGDDGKEALKRDIELYARASQRLAERGYRAESVRMREIVRELMVRLDPPSIAERAAELLAGDIQDRAVRVPIIELAAEGYAAGGWETNAEILRWFASIGRGQLTDGVTEMLPMPEAANAGPGSVMDNLIELVLGAAGMHKHLGNEEAAKACMRLGRFYVERELGAFTNSQPRIGALGGRIDRLRLIGPPELELGLESKDNDVTTVLREIGYVGDVEIGIDAIAIDDSRSLRGLGYVDGAEVGLDVRASAPSSEGGALNALGYGGDVEARDVPPVDVEQIEVPALAVGTYRILDRLETAVADPDPHGMRDLEMYLERLQAQVASLEAQLAEERAKLDAGKRKANGGR